jgi:putative phosphoribosyl transferase
MPSAHDELLLEGFHDQLAVEIGTPGLKALLGIAGPGASHLFEEPGTLDAVVAHATGWFAHRLQAEHRRRGPS